MNEEEIKTAVGRHSNWFHKIQLPHGIVTPGTADSKTKMLGLYEVGLPRDLKGMRVLDIGCMDGYFAFEMERRGADVVAIDRRSFTGSKFETASLCLNSHVKYLEQNVYQMNPKEIGHFDVVLFLGVLYHLRHPLLALEEIRSVISPDGVLFLNTLILDSFLFDSAGQESKLEIAAPELLEVPLWQHLPGVTLAEDITNQFIPNKAAVRAAFYDTNFTCVSETAIGIGGFFKAQPTNNQVIADWVSREREVKLNAGRRSLKRAKKRASAENTDANS